MKYEIILFIKIVGCIILLNFLFAMLRLLMCDCERFGAGWTPFAPLSSWFQRRNSNSMVRYFDFAISSYDLEEVCGQICCFTVDPFLQLWCWSCFACVLYVQGNRK